DVPAASTALCPAGSRVIAGSTCYSVTVTTTVPLYLAPLVGYTGDTTIGTANGKLIRASARAGLVSSSRAYCLIGKTDISISGGGKDTNFRDCDFLSGGTMKCVGTGSDKGVVHGDATGLNGTAGGSGTCGTSPRSGI